MKVQAAFPGHGATTAVPGLFAHDIAAGRPVYAVEHAIRDEWAYWVVYPQECQHGHRIRLFRDWIQAAMDRPVMASSRRLTRPTP